MGAARIAMGALTVPFLAIALCLPQRVGGSSRPGAAFVPGHPLQLRMARWGSASTCSRLSLGSNPIVWGAAQGQQCQQRRHPFAWGLRGRPLPLASSRSDSGESVQGEEDAERQLAGECVQGEEGAETRREPKFTVKRAEPGSVKKAEPGKTGFRQGREQQTGQQDIATRDQIELNMRLAQLSDPEEVLAEVDQARMAGVEMNLVNHATALSKIAKAQHKGGRGAPATLAKDGRFTWMMQALQRKLKATSGKLDPRCISNLSWSLASLKVSGTDAVLSAVLGRIFDSGLGEMQAQALSTFAWACAKRSEELGAELTDQVLDAVSRECERRGAERVSPQDVSNLVWAFATMRVYSRGILNLVDGAVQRGMEGWSAQSLSNVMWGLARLGIKPCSASKAVANEAARRNLEGFSSQELSNLVWGATVGNGGMSRELSDGVERWLSSNSFVKPQHLTVTLWSFAKSGLRSPVLFRSAEEMVSGSLSGLAEFSPQAISNLVWSFATVGIVSHDIFAIVEASIEERRMDDFKPQEVANLAWAFSKAGMDGGYDDADAGVVWTCVEETMASRGMDKFEAAHVAIIGWACARRMRRNTAPPGQFPRSMSRSRSISPRRGRDSCLASVMSLVSSEIKARGLGDFKPQELSILAWAYATSGGLAGPQVLSDLVVEINTRDLSFFNAQGLTNIAWAYAHWLQGPNNLAAGLFASIDGEIQRRGLSTFKSAEVAVFTWAFAKTGQKDAPLLVRSHDRLMATDDLADYSEQSLVMCLWALAVTDRASAALLDRVEGEMLERGLGAFKAREINAAVFALSKAKHTSQRLWDAIDAEAGDRARSPAKFEAGETLRDYSMDVSHPEPPRGGSYDAHEAFGMGDDEDQEEEGRGRSRMRS